VDLSNLVLGVLSGKGLSGVAEKPVGGSAWLNEKFGIQGEGLISDAVEMAGSSVNPAGLAKSLAILVPAIVTKDANTILKAQRALKKGADPAEVFADTGIYKNPASKRSHVSYLGCKLPASHGESEHNSVSDPYGWSDCNAISSLGC
jgi:hypothetical protein